MGKKLIFEVEVVVGVVKVTLGAGKCLSTFLVEGTCVQRS